ncbi:glycosyltransferase family 4 protein [Candidatus Microgenomates bacterium]|nr:glycosyltransferase family 4 protein [Candidatus Microgenomates bacterium]
MRIVIDGRFYGLEHGGLGRYTTELINSLSKIDTKNKYFVLLRKKYFETLKLPKNWDKVLVDYKHYTFAEQINLPKIINKLNPDLTHFLHFNTPLFMKGPYVVTIHDMIMHESKGIDTTTLPSYQYLFKRVGYRLAFWNAVKRASKIITPSVVVKNNIVDYFRVNPDEVCVTHLGINKSFFDYEGAVKKEDYFLYVGSAYPHKNLISLIKAVKKLDTKLVIVSSRNVFTKRLQKTIRELDAEKNIKLVGYLDDIKLKRLYAKAIAFVYPSLLEGFGFQGLEAMARKTLLLSSDTKVFKEVYKDNAIYFDPKDVDSITNALKKTGEMKVNETKKRINKAYLYAKKFTWQKTAQKTLDLYDEFSEK